MSFTTSMRTESWGTSASWDESHYHESHYTSFLLWDIDREFQNAHEAYEEWMTKNRRKWYAWCIASSRQEDVFGKALSLGRNVQKLIEDGQEAFGPRFDRGDSTCRTILSAQLLRLQYEVSGPLFDCLHSRIPYSIPYNDILKAAKGVRRACLDALRDQYSRLSSKNPAPFLPPPRFSVKFCPFALQLQKDRQQGHISTIRARKVRLHNPIDDREMCPCCNIHIHVAAHSGLPDYRRILFQSHISPAKDAPDGRATFACSGCYKTFHDSYAFLDHVFQKEIGSERSCMRSCSARFSVTEALMASDAVLLEKCLKNCVQREMTRARILTKSKELSKS